MKKKFSLAGLILLISAAVTFIAFAPPQNDKNKGQQNQGKNNDKGNQGKKNDNANKGNADGNQGQGKDNKGNQGNQGNNADKDNKGNQGNSGDKGNNDNNGNNRGNSDNANKKSEYNYQWTKETFKDRNKIKGQQKVTICHKFNRGDANAVTISVSANALKAHMGHGDVMGNCPAYADKRYSDKYWRTRDDYYNYIYQNEDQVYYSRSILDYAVERLTGARLQLNMLENSNMPPAQIEQKRVTVVELEQNVSLLERLISAAAVYAADRLL